MTVTASTSAMQAVGPFGSAGHNYQVSVRIDWWTGKDNVASFAPTYTQILSGRYLNPSSCSF